MTLRPTSDVGAARWFASADAHPSTLVTMGPPGFGAYARVRFDLDEGGRLDSEVFDDVIEVAAGHTTTPDHAWFGLWGGWGDIDGGESAGLVSAVGDSSWFGRVFRPARPPQVLPAFEPAVLAGPRLHVGDRDYLVFTGPLAQSGDWGARPIAAGWPPRTISDPNLVWPDDRAWFVANDAEPDWLGVGGTPQLIDALRRHPRLLTEPAAYDPHPPVRGS